MPLRFPGPWFIRQYVFLIILNPLTSIDRRNHVSLVCFWLFDYLFCALLTWHGFMLYGFREFWDSYVDRWRRSSWLWFSWISGFVFVLMSVVGGFSNWHIFAFSSQIEVCMCMLIRWMLDLLSGIGLGDYN